MNTQQRAILEALHKSWSAESSSLWSLENPAKGHCGVTAIVIQENFGGDILKTYVGGTPHFYNRVAGVNIDFTSSQFDVPPRYEDVLSDREEAFADTNMKQYNSLNARFKSEYCP